MRESDIDTAGISSATSDGRLITVSGGAIDLQGILTIPQHAKGLVIFANGIEDSSENTHKNAAYCVQVFNTLRLATLIVDLFTKEERELDTLTEFFRLNTEIMEQRIIGLAYWLYSHPETANFSHGFFGTGASGAAALIAAAKQPDTVAAVVAAAGCVELARDVLSHIMAPTLLIAAEKDEASVKANQEALDLLTIKRKQLTKIEGVTSLYEDQRALDKVARLAGEWFASWLIPIV